jgi:hypothetical protein
VEIWSRIAEHHGGYFDPTSGTRDERKLARTELLVGDERNSKAVEIASSPLLTRPRQTSTKP